MSEHNTKRRDPLFGTSADLQEIVEIKLGNLRPDPKQPRKTFEEDSLDELARTIEEHGLLQPILVRPDPEQDEGYIIISGERRFRAHQRLGRETIQAIIRKASDEKQARAIALVENVQREDLNPVELAEGYAQLMEEHGFTQEDLAEKVGKSRTSITGTLALNRLPQKVREEAKRSTVSKSKLVELAQLGDENRQLALWEKLKRGITVAEARAVKQESTRKPQLLSGAVLERRFRTALKTGRELSAELDRTLSDEYLLKHDDDLRELKALHADLLSITAKIGQHLKSTGRKKGRQNKEKAASLETEGRAGETHDTEHVASEMPSDA